MLDRGVPTQFHPFMPLILVIHAQFFRFSFFQVLHFKSTQILLVKFDTILRIVLQKFSLAGVFALQFHPTHPSLHFTVESKHESGLTLIRATYKQFGA